MNIHKFQNDFVRLALSLDKYYKKQMGFRRDGVMDGAVKGMEARKFKRFVYKI